MTLLERFFSITEALISLEGRSFNDEALRSFKVPSGKIKRGPKSRAKPVIDESLESPVVEDLKELQKELADFEELLGIRSSADQPTKEELEDL